MISGSRSDMTISLGRLCSLGPASSGRCRTKLATPGVLSHFSKLVRPSQHAKHRKGRRGCWCSVLLRLSSFGSCRTHECPLHNGKSIKQQSVRSSPCISTTFPVIQLLRKLSSQAQLQPQGLGSPMQRRTAGEHIPTKYY